MSKVLPWSFSSLNAFEQCPRRFKLTRIDKLIKEPQTTATLHGNEVHSAFEHHVKGTATLPTKYGQPWRDIADRIKKAPGKKLVEFKFALTKAFRSTEFFAKDAWVRGVIDIGVLGTKQATVLDYKTGKPKPDTDQLKLFAGVTLAAFPYLEKVKTGYIWLAHNRIDSQEFTKADVPMIWQEFLPRVGRMEAALAKDDFPPKPSGLCNAWCPVGRKLCEFCGKD
jgi:hypothetical protein